MIFPGSCFCCYIGIERNFLNDMMEPSGFECVLVPRRSEADFWGEILCVFWGEIVSLI